MPYCFVYREKICIICGSYLAGRNLHFDLIFEKVGGVFLLCFYSCLCDSVCAVHRVVVFSFGRISLCSVGEGSYPMAKSGKSPEFEETLS